METKTPEQILKPLLQKVYGENVVVEKEAIKAMETYATQQTTKLKADNTLLKEVNEAQAFTIDKYKADKDKLAKDLKGCFDYYNLIANSKTSNYGQKANYLNKAAIIKRTLSECGYNI